MVERLWKLDADLVEKPPGFESRSPENVLDPDSSVPRSIATSRECDRQPGCATGSRFGPF